MTAARAARHGLANRVRIIGGAWRSRYIHFVSHDELRPTPDRVRETLFNWLGQDLSGRSCLDLYAGSGALGFEAASRGAQRVVMVERDRAIYAALGQTRLALAAESVELVRANALEFLRGDSGRYDVVFLDPPFRDADWPRMLASLQARLNAGALVYVESAKSVDVPPGWEIRRKSRAGQVHFELLQRAEHE
ncbi:MAG: 16S rRNA (guanine(966)-N(2))-methyltransferase RsmD [Betaproteobacteria bacterium]